MPQLFQPEFVSIDAFQWIALAAIPLEEVSDQCDPIVMILSAVQNGTLGLVAAADKIDEVAMASSLCREMKIDVRSMGVDITNRGGQGVFCVGGGLAGP